MTDFNVETLNYYYKQNVLKKCTKSRDHRMYLSVTEWVFKGFQNSKHVQTEVCHNIFVYKTSKYNIHKNFNSCYMIAVHTRNWKEKLSRMPMCCRFLHLYDILFLKQFFLF